MATLVLVPVLGALGAAALPGMTLFGASLGLMLGQMAGALIGGWIDSKLFGASGQTQAVEGARMDDLKVTSSTEGSPLPRLYGRSRMGGQIIWATNLEEVRSETTQDSGGGGGKGMGGGGGGGGGTVTQITYNYYANFAVAICTGEVTSLGRIWADGKELDLSQYTYRFYRGTDTQVPDSLMEAKEGAGKVPAYRGVCYIVFERMHLEKFGNRIPQLNFEVFRAVDNFEKSIRAITILPGSGEFVYATEEYRRYLYTSWPTIGSGVRSDTATENVHTRRGNTDWKVSMDDMENSFENLKNTSLIVAWFGTDLRCANCSIVPGVENRQKSTTPAQWAVAGYNRGNAHLISTHDGGSAYGGTPSDATVVAAIQDLKARGLGVTFYPFIMMDIPSGNSLPNPYAASGNGQSVYPWRGRITLSKAPGVSGSPDKTAAAATEINTFVTQFRTFILHYANLCATAGGVDAFLIGTEMRGMTTARSSSSTYPFVTALKTLAADVKAILPSAKIVYGADWSEYFGHSAGDGTGDFYFHLDPLWSDANISAIGIDCYWPLSDWRQGTGHADKLAGHKSIYEFSYLKGNVQGGEGFDWYYASQGARDSQTRTPITDGYGKPWVWRYKDIKSWWTNQHFNRPGGVQSGSPTSWVPQSKPFWFTEIGCPAINCGSNQPNVFYDPKSSESFFPYYSNGVRDDFMQRRHIQAFYEYWDHTHEDYVNGANPVSSVYGGRMVDIERIYTYTWDARPYPAFPYSDEVWADRTNWPYGHWLTGRVSGGALDSVIRAIMADYGFTSFDASGLSGQVEGYVLDRIMSVRDALQVLEIIYFFDSFESEGIIKFRHRGAFGSQIVYTQDDLVDNSEGGGSGGGGDGARLFEITRAQETELPLANKLTYFDGTNDYKQGTVESRRLTVHSDRTATVQAPIVMRQAMAQSIADIMLQETWVTREKARFSIPPSDMFLEPSDVITLNVHNHNYKFRVIGLSDHGARDLELLQIDPSIYEHVRAADRITSTPPGITYGQPSAFFMDLPLLSDLDNEAAGYVSAQTNPWPGSVVGYRSVTTSNFGLNFALSQAATVGTTLYDFYNGPTGYFDTVNQLIVELVNGELSSVSELEVLGGSNVCALKNLDGEWEILQFQNAELIASRQYKLTKLLRGQLGTELQMRSPLVAGSTFILLTPGTVRQVSMGYSDIGIAFNYKYGPGVRSINDASYVTTSFTYKGVARRPYAPVHPRLAKVGTDLVLSWVRRSRIGGDSWDTEEIPLGEEYEAYDLEIYNAAGTAIVRTVRVTSPSYTYSQANYTADFGAQPTAIKVSIYQVSPYGRGSLLQDWVNLTRVS